MKTLSCGMWDLVPRSGMEPGPLHWKCRVLATGLPGKSPCDFWSFCLWHLPSLSQQGMSQIAVRTLSVTGNRVGALPCPYVIPERQGGTLADQWGCSTLERSEATEARAVCSVHCSCSICPARSMAHRYVTSLGGNPHQRREEAKKRPNILNTYSVPLD